MNISLKKLGRDPKRLKELAWAVKKLFSEREIANLHIDTGEDLKQDELMFLALFEFSNDERTQESVTDVCFYRDGTAGVYPASKDPKNRGLWLEGLSAILLKASVLAYEIQKRTEQVEIGSKQIIDLIADCVPPEKRRRKSRKTRKGVQR